jgi:hypothetical protein
MNGLIVATIVEKRVAATAAATTSLACYRFELFSKALSTVFEVIGKD